MYSKTESERVRKIRLEEHDSSLHPAAQPIRNDLLAILCPSSALPLADSIARYFSIAITTV